MTRFQILDYSKHFENFKSRERDHLAYVCIPNKQHGMGFTRIMAEADGAAIYGVWCLIVGACSQQRKPRHGWLTDDGTASGTPWTIEDIAFKFRRPLAEIQRAIEFLSSPRIGWMVVEQTESPSDHAAHPSTTRQASAAHPPTIEGWMDGRMDGGKDSVPASRSAVSGNSVAVGDEPAGFLKFWSTWPSHSRKKGRPKCLKLWKAKKLEPLTTTIVAAVGRFMASEDWLKLNGKYIPGPHPWLSDEAWNVPADALTASPIQTNADDELHNLPRYVPTEDELEEIYPGRRERMAAANNGSNHR